LESVLLLLAREAVVVGLLLLLLVLVLKAAHLLSVLSSLLLNPLLPRSIPFKKDLTAASTPSTNSSRSSADASKQWLVGGFQHA
jgi:hypothetical protein